MRINFDLPQPAAAGSATTAGSALPRSPLALDPKKYELEVAITDVWAHLLGRYEGVRSSNHVVLEGGLHFNMDASFKRADLQQLLATRGAAHLGHRIQAVYATSLKAWSHPHDGELRMRECLGEELRIKACLETESIGECLKEPGVDEGSDKVDDEVRMAVQCKLAGMYACSMVRSWHRGDDGVVGAALKRAMLCSVTA